MRWFVVLAVGCGSVGGAMSGGEPAPASASTSDPSSPAFAVGHDRAGNRGVRVGGEHGVLVGDQAEVDGVRVGGDHGVMVGDDGTTQGVRVGGEKGVVVGQDANTQGVRVGGQKGVEVDVKKGVSIGGKKLLGKP